MYVLYFLQRFSMFKGLIDMPNSFRSLDSFEFLRNQIWHNLHWDLEERLAGGEKGIVPFLCLQFISQRGIRCSLDEGIFSCEEVTISLVCSDNQRYVEHGKSTLSIREVSGNAHVPFCLNQLKRAST